MNLQFSAKKLCALLLAAGFLISSNLIAAELSYDEKALSGEKTWTSGKFQNDPARENVSDSFRAIQGMLKDCKRTFLAGHLHYCDYDLIDGYEHITIGPAGASCHHDGPGTVDHIMWVTMTEDGLEFANIALKGVFDRTARDTSISGAYERKGAE